MSPRRVPRAEPPGEGADDRDRGRGVERIGDLLPTTARRLGLDEQLDLAAAMEAWRLIVAEHVPEAVGACRLTAFERGVATIVADQPIVAQELRLRAGQLTPALRSAVRAPVRELRIVVGHV